MGHPTRVGALRELAKGQALPVGELARRLGFSSNAMSKQMALLEKTGAVQRIYGRLYTLAPDLRPAPGVAVLDLGDLVLKLSPAA
jgi:DNA-binding transcriptional ArsR family regulator